MSYSTDVHLKNVAAGFLTDLLNDHQRNCKFNTNTLFNIQNSIEFMLYELPPPAAMQTRLDLRTVYNPNEQHGLVKPAQQQVDRFNKNIDKWCKDIRANLLPEVITDLNNQIEKIKNGRIYITYEEMHRIFMPYMRCYKSDPYWPTQILALHIFGSPLEISINERKILIDIFRHACVILFTYSSTISNITHYDSIIRLIFLNNLITPVKMRPQLFEFLKHSIPYRLSLKKNNEIYPLLQQYWQLA